MLEAAIASALSTRPDLDSSRTAAFPCTAARVDEGGVEGLTIILGVAVSQAEAEASRLDRRRRCRLTTEAETGDPSPVHA